MRFRDHVPSLPALMNISVFGLGYVGAVTAGCLTDAGHSVVGIDVSRQKVEALARGEPPILEPGLDSLLQAAVQGRRLSATTEVADAIHRSDVSLVCVGTPSTTSGTLDLRFVRQVVEEIGNFLRKNPKRHVLIIRSTVLPGTTRGLVAEFLSDLVSSGTLDVYYYPEFLREGTAVEDFKSPSLSVLGTGTGSLNDPGVMGLVGPSASVVKWDTAEMVKYACNAFHAMKIVFANEVGRLGKELGVDAAGVMTILCTDKKLNLSAYYLRPGNPFGGSCLPKDVRALTHEGRRHGLSLPLLESLLPSNEQHLRQLFHLVERSEATEVAIIGLSFKPNTDDLRESAMVEVAQILLGRGFKVRIYDPQLNLAKLVGSNRRLIDTKMPHLASLLCSDLKSALGDRGLVLVAQQCATIAELGNHITSEHRVIDINGWPDLRRLSSHYEAFCW